MEKKKVLILSNGFRHYRIPFWNKLAEKYDLTVGYSTGKYEEDNQYNFKVIYMPVRRIGCIVLNKGNVLKLARQFDVVVAYGNIAWLRYSTLPWFGVKTVFHTIGVSASYDKAYDGNHSWDNVRDFFYSKASAIAYYTDYPIKKALQQGKPTDKFFVAPNTVDVINIKPIKKDSILFIGTIYKAKGLDKLLEAYLIAAKRIEMPVLNIIGNGPDLESIKKWVVFNGLENRIILHGAIYDLPEKAKFFAKSLACISPNQAGLAVLESMGYGVPFITAKNAITGGEIFNIENGKTGILFDSTDDIADILVDIAENPLKFEEMGVEAKKFYDSNRTINHMAEGMSQAIEYALDKYHR